VRACPHTRSITLSNKKITFITPPVTLVWPKLNEPDVFKPKKGEPKVRYVTDAKLREPDLKKLQKYLADLAKKYLPDVEKPKLPFKVDKKTKDVLLTASSGVKYRPPMFDARNQKLPVGVIIGGGTEAKLDLSVNFYEMSAENSGINLYIRAGQILKLVEGGFKSSFEEAEGFTYSGVDDGEDSDDTTPDHNDSDDDDAFTF
jgi:hypothetical protein